MRINKQVIEGMTIRQKVRLARKIEHILSTSYTASKFRPNIQYDDLLKVHRMLSNRRTW